LFAAEDGEAGKKDSLHGANGDDLEILFPIGSVITNMETEEKIQLLNEGEKVLLLKGGKGGLGNEHFKSSTNQQPKKVTLGREGGEADFYIELQLVVDVGLIGYPNAGKSSLLNELTNATAKIGAYQFTTLEPNLGAFYGYILADIPGLIEGASEGKGLGYKFLRHIKRTKMLAHLISLEQEDVKKAYQTIRKELTEFDPELALKKEIIVLSKTDMTDEKGVEKAKKALAKCKVPIYTVSILDNHSLKQFRDDLTHELNSSSLKSKVK
jgi:GTP-binding protein